MIHSTVFSVCVGVCAMPRIVAFPFAVVHFPFHRFFVFGNGARRVVHFH